MSCQTMLSKVYNNVAKAPNSWAIKYISTQHVSVIDRIILSENSANWNTQTGGLLASKFLLCYPRWMDLFVHGCISSLHLFFLTAYPTRRVNWAKSGAHLLYYKDETEKQDNKRINLISISVRANQSTWSITAGKRRENIEHTETTQSAEGRFERYCCSEYFGKDATHKISLDYWKFLWTKRSEHDRNRVLAYQRGYRLVAQLLMLRFDYLVFPDWETPWLSTRSTPHAYVFVFSFHCVEEFPFNVCLKNEKATLCRTRLTLVSELQLFLCLAARIKLVMCFYRLNTHKCGCACACTRSSNCLEVIKLRGPTRRRERENKLFHPRDGHIQHHTIKASVEITQN